MSVEERQTPAVSLPTPALLAGSGVLILLSAVLPWLWVAAAPLAGAVVARARLAGTRKQARLWSGLLLLWLPLCLWDVQLLWGLGLSVASTLLLTALFRRGYDRLNTSLALQLVILLATVGAFYLALAQWLETWHPATLLDRFVRQMSVLLEQVEVRLEEVLAQQPQNLASTQAMVANLRKSLSLMLPSLLPGAVTLSGFVAFACTGRLAAGAPQWAYPLPNRYTGLLLLSLLAGMLPLGTGAELAASAVASFAGTVLLCEGLHWLFIKINAMEAPAALAFMLKGAAVLVALVLNLYAVLGAACLCLYRGMKAVLPPPDGSK